MILVFSLVLLFRIIVAYALVMFGFMVELVSRYDVVVDVAPQVAWLLEDKYKNLKIVVEIDDIINAQSASEKELRRRHKGLGSLRIVTDRGLQVIID